MSVEAQQAKRSRMFQSGVTVIGLSVWLAATALLFTRYTLRDQLIVLALVPLIIVVSMFMNIFQLPSGAKLTNEKFNFTLSDAIILLVAYWYGPCPAVFVAGIEGFNASRRTSRRASNILFSSGMISLAAGASAATLCAMLGQNLTGSSADHSQSFITVTVVLLVASIVQTIVNMGLLSTLLALRHNSRVLSVFREQLVWAIPMFLSTSAAASSMNVAVQQGTLAMIAIGGSLIISIYFWHRQYCFQVQARVETTEKAHRETIEALAVAINAKDEVTHDHVLRVQIYAAGVARLLGCSQAEIEALKAGALLHDIGKISVPDYILNKPGKLTAAEFEKMKMHTIVGAQILGRVEFPYPVVPVVRHHHERWDGQGYPDGLAGEAIPLTARILTVVDCFDAVREDRQYRRGLTREEAIALIMSGSGSQYDPRIVGTFITHLPEFEAEIQAMRDVPLPTFGIGPSEELSDTARSVAPAAGLEETEEERDVLQLPPIGIDETDAEYQARAMEGDIRSRREAITAAFIEKLSSIISYDTCAITTVEQETGESTVTHALGEHASALLGRTVELGEGVTGWAMANRRSFCNTDPKLDLPPSLAQHFQLYRALAVFPVVKDEHIFGALSLYSYKLVTYSREQQRAIEEAVALFAGALESASIDILEVMGGEAALLHVGGTEEAATVPDNSALMPEAGLDSALTH
jgi:putative nucleotidyltransferase with HDIG domain